MRGKETTGEQRASEGLRSNWMAGVGGRSRMGGIESGSD